MLNVNEPACAWWRVTNVIITGFFYLPAGKFTLSRQSPMILHCCVTIGITIDVAMFQSTPRETWINEIRAFVWKVQIRSNISCCVVLYQRQADERAAVELSALDKANGLRIKSRLASLDTIEQHVVWNRLALIFFASQELFPSRRG